MKLTNSIAAPPPTPEEVAVSKARKAKKARTSVVQPRAVLRKRQVAQIKRNYGVDYRREQREERQRAREAKSENKV